MANLAKIGQKLPNPDQPDERYDHSNEKLLLRPARNTTSCIEGATINTRNTVFAVTREVRGKGKTLSRKWEGGEGGVTDALLRRVTTLRSKQNRLTSARQSTATRHDSSD